MKPIATMMLSLDGVYQGPGGPDEDRRSVTILTNLPVARATFGRGDE